MNKQALRQFFHKQSVIRQKLGTVDCVTFVTQAVYVGWGRDYRSVLQFDDRRSAVNRLRELGGLKKACLHAMGSMYYMEDLEPGDVIWYDKPQPTLGLLMPGFVLVRGAYSIHRHAADDHLMGWKTAEGIS